MHWCFSWCSLCAVSLGAAFFVCYHSVVFLDIFLVSSFLKNFIHLLTVLGLPSLLCVGSVVVVCGPWSTGSVVTAHRLSCSSACGIFPDQKSNVPFIGRLDPSGSLLCWCLKPGVWGAPLLRIWGLGCPMLNSDPSLFRENSHTFVILPNCGLWARCGFSFGVSLFLLLVSLLSFYPLLWRFFSSSFQVSFRGNYCI